MILESSIVDIVKQVFIGECIITLQDVSIILALPIDGVVVSGTTCLDWREMCATLLGAVPEDGDISGQRLHLTWLTEHFPSLPPDADVESVRCYARAFILQLIGGFLFADKSNNMVHLMFLPLFEDLGVTGTYNWGSACLAWLYREMCRASRIDAHDVSGSLILLQVQTTLVPRLVSLTIFIHLGKAW
ncbi:hypothetical protein AAG906_036217 [Vitis piasezkii]